MFLIEVTPGGFIRPYYSFSTYRLELYVFTQDFIRGGMEFLIVCLLAYFCYNEIAEMRQMKKMHGTVKPYFSDPWNILDLLNLGFYWVVVIMLLIYFFDQRRKTLGQKVEHAHDYINFQGVATQYINIFNFNSVNILLSFLKLFKYLQISPRILVLWDTLNKAKTDLMAFMIFFLIVFIAFSTMGHLLFGPTIREYRTFQESFMACFQIVLGQFNYSEFVRANRLLGPWFFAVFVVLVYFTLANVFLAIINDAYQDVHSENVSLETVSELIMRGMRKRWWRTRTKLKGLMGDPDATSEAKQDKADRRIMDLFTLSREIEDDEPMTYELARKVLGESAPEVDVKRLVFLCERNVNRALRKMKEDGMDMSEISNIVGVPEGGFKEALADTYNTTGRTSTIVGASEFASMPFDSKTALPLVQVETEMAPIARSSTPPHPFAPPVPPPGLASDEEVDVSMLPVGALQRELRQLAANQAVQQRQLAELKDLISRMVEGPPKGARLQRDKSWSQKSTGGLSALGNIWQMGSPGHDGTDKKVK